MQLLSANQTWSSNVRGMCSGHCSTQSSEC